MLSFAATCVREGRLFFSRILTVLKDAYHSKIAVMITCEMKKDLAWWETFLSDYNGISCIPDNVWSRPDETFSSDSCLSGCEACSSTNYFHFEIPDSIIQQGQYINQFDLYVILIAVREWAQMFANKNILIYCDNHTSVQVLHHGRLDCTFMQWCLREIRYHSAKFNFRIRAVHLKGVDNRISDCLSRWHLSQSYSDTFYEATKSLKFNRNNSFEFWNFQFLVDMGRGEWDTFIHLPINCQILNLLTVGIV